MWASPSARSWGTFLDCCHCPPLALCPTKLQRNTSKTLNISTWTVRGVTQLREYWKTSSENVLWFRKRFESESWCWFYFISIIFTLFFPEAFYLLYSRSLYNFVRSSLLGQLYNCELWFVEYLMGCSRGKTRTLTKYKSDWLFTI